MTRFEIAQAHAKNRKQILKAITQTNQALNWAVKENKPDLEYANIRILMVLFSAYLESSLGFILNFYGAQITTAAQRKVLSEPSEIKKWKLLFEYLFRKRYMGGKRWAINIKNVGFTAHRRYEYIEELIDSSLTPIIEVRNKLAHGQWAIAFTSEGANKNQPMTTKIWSLSKKDTLLTKTITKKFVHTMEALAASRDHFEKTFDKNVKDLETNKAQYEERYEWLLSEIRRKRRPSNNE